MVVTEPVLLSSRRPILDVPRTLYSVPLYAEDEPSPSDSSEDFSRWVFANMESDNVADAERNPRFQRWTPVKGPRHAVGKD